MAQKKKPAAPRKASQRNPVQNTEARVKAARRRAENSGVLKYKDEIQETLDYYPTGDKAKAAKR